MMNSIPSEVRNFGARPIELHEDYTAGEADVVLSRNGKI
jgi:hypothetical protein